MEPIMNCTERVQETFQLFSKFECDDWKPVGMKDGIAMSSQGISDSLLMVQFSYVVDLPFDQVSVLYRPETMFLKEHPLSGSYLTQSTVVKSFAPGDNVVSMEMGNGLQCLMALLFGWSCGKVLIRSILRCDFPKPGQYAMINMNLSDYRNTSPTGILLSPLENSGRTSVREFLTIPCKCSWLLHLLGSKLLSWWNIDQLISVTPAICHSLQEKGYLVVVLKKCCRGSPLVPRCWENSPLNDPADLPMNVQWEKYDDDDTFQFSSYLRHVMATLGLGQDVVFDSLDGRNLVFFQAAVQKSQWFASWKVLSSFMKQHQAAYRRFYGGSGAPYIQVDTAPRFVDDGATAFAGATEPSKSIDEEEQWRWRPVEVRNTFVHFVDKKLQEDTVSAP